jgi:hypothetical protein
MRLLFSLLATALAVLPSVISGVHSLGEITKNYENIQDTGAITRDINEIRGRRGEVFSAGEGERFSHGNLRIEKLDNCQDRLLEFDRISPSTKKTIASYAEARKAEREEIEHILLFLKK